MITYRELKEKYFSFFQKYNHTLITGASLIPENDPTVLFTTAGMHPLVPYLLGEKHAGGQRLVDVQKCLRTSDIDEVGDNSHLTFFEMLGNWSLGDYFKAESIKMSYEFLTSKEYLNIDSQKLYFTVFAGNEQIPKDIESYECWINNGVPVDHLFFLPMKDNFWILGSGVGPCGPDTEIFFDTGKEACSSNCSPACGCGKYLEIWNNVFMEYMADGQGHYTKLTAPNVDTGMGLERTLTILNDLTSVYDCEVFVPLKDKLISLSNKDYQTFQKDYRIIMDHLRTSVFLLGDEKHIVPNNTGQGYVLRRLIRRTVLSLSKLDINFSFLNDLIMLIIDNNPDYPELLTNKEFIITEINKEIAKFNTTLKSGRKHFDQVLKKSTNNIINGEDAFKLFDTFGFPLEITKELALENSFSVDEPGFYERFKQHQNISRSIDVGTFKGGLADNSYESTKYHTLAHIILATLQKMYGQDVIQKGCNITAERIRFDFNLDHKMTEDEKNTLTETVNQVIKEGHPVIMQEMSYDSAKAMGAHGTFVDKYHDQVKVYTIENVSREICNGPHVKNTNELGTFLIQKEESSSAGVRRIKAILK